MLRNLGFPIFSPISKRQWVPGDSDVVGHRGNFFNGKVFRNWNGTLPTYIEVPKKILRKISNEKFFTADPYFGYTFKTGFPKMAKNGTFGHF